MRRCGRADLHAPHGDCDGRTINEAGRNVCTVRELRLALAQEQGGAIVTVGDTPIAPPRPDRRTGRPVVKLELVEPAAPIQTVHPDSP